MNITSVWVVWKMNQNKVEAGTGFEHATTYTRVFRLAVPPIADSLIILGILNIR
jgi:hypothetical protein